jgi:hypothetical protein
MPLHESRRNAENRIEIEAAHREAITSGAGPVVGKILGLIAERQDASRPMRMALDGWYGVDWDSLVSVLRERGSDAGLNLDIRAALELFRPREEIEAYKAPFVETGDPGFGVVNVEGTALVPACFGACEFVNDEGGDCTVVQMRWKRG